MISNSSMFSLYTIVIVSVDRQGKDDAVQVDGDAKHTHTRVPEQAYFLATITYSRARD